MSLSKPSGVPPDPDAPCTIPELPRPAEPVETPPPVGATSPQLPGLVTRNALGRLSAPEPLPGGPDIPGYVVTEEIARGGMGVVYAAREPALARKVAIKTLLPAMAGHEEMIAQFQREARITAHLPHPCVPPVHALGVLEDGRPFLVMKLIHGRTLAAILKARSAMSSDSTAELDPTTPNSPGLLLVFEHICQAVAFAHARGIIHRDLKPQNIMVGPFGEVQVMDWGLAREVQPSRRKSPDADTISNRSVPTRRIVSGDATATQLGSAKGTPSYMPPEQARGDWDRVDTRADVFALGGLLCALLTGLAPYTGANARAVFSLAVEANLKDAFARLDACGADVELVRLAKWCLSANPADRPPDAGTVAALVECYRLGQEERLRKCEMSRATPRQRNASARKPVQPEQTHPRLWRWLLLAAGIGILIGFGSARVIASMVAPR